MSKRQLSPDEKRAWARVTRNVRALAEPATLPDPDEPIETQPSGSPTRQMKVTRPLSGKPLAKTKRAPIQDKAAERRVRRGQAPIAATLDLHGHTQHSAHLALLSFLGQQRARDARCVLVITGKGKLGEGILRRRFLQWLETDEARAIVSGYAGAHAKHGGSGAWYVFLRRR